jgi:hypothetical protein
MTDLELARSEHTPQSELLRLLESGTPAVRRAVASNLNAGPEVLKKASKLNYLSVVLKNRSFHHQVLFSDDPWIKAIYEIYKNPAITLGVNSNSGVGWQFGAWSWSKQRHFIALLRILSPNIDLDSLDRSIENISSEDFKRVLRDKEVKKKIIHLCNKALDDKSIIYPFSLSSLLKMYNFGLIDEKYVIKATAHFGIGSTSLDSSVSASSIRAIVKKFESPCTTIEQKTSIINCFSSWLLVCRGSIYISIGKYFWDLKEETIKGLLIPVYRKISFITEKTSLIDFQVKTFRENLLVAIQKNVRHRSWQNYGAMKPSELKAINVYLDWYLDRKETNSAS